MTLDDDHPNSAIIRTLDWAYDRAVEGIAGAESAEDIGDEYLHGEGTVAEKVDRLIRWQVAKCGASGFVGGLAGLGALPIAVPATMTTVLYVQLRMIAAIAHMGGHDVRSDRMRTLAYACLCGNAAKEVVKDAGIVLGTKLTHQMLAHLSGRLLSRIEARATSRLFSRMAATSLTQIGRMVPLVGGTIGAFVDGSTTYVVGRVARQMFISN